MALLSAPRGYTSMTSTLGPIDSKELAAAWNQLLGCWSGVVTFEGIPAVRRGRSDYEHCCIGSTRMIQTRVSFSVLDDVPVVDRFFQGRLDWTVDSEVLLSMSGVILLGLSHVRSSSILPSESQQSDGDISLAVELRPPSQGSLQAAVRSAAAFECYDVHLRHDADRLTMRSVVYYPRHGYSSKILYACPHFDRVEPAASIFPEPRRCRETGSGGGIWNGCLGGSLSNASNALGLHEEAVTFIEYDLARSDLDHCHAVNLSVQLASSAAEVHVPSLMLIIVIAIISLGIASPLIFRLCLAAYHRRRASDGMAAQMTDTIGARIADDVEHKECQPKDMSSGIAFHGHASEILRVGHSEHWHVTSESLTQLKLVTSGGFGAVFRAMMHRSSPVAVKTIKEIGGVHRLQLGALKHEARILRRIRHPNIVLFQGVTTIEYENATHLALVLEWIQGGDMVDYLCRVRADNRQGDLDCLLVRLLTDASRALLYLHHQDPIVVHMDLKPETVLIEDTKPPRAKLTDFGLSALLRGEVVHAKIGTPAYMAPEVRLRQSYDASADIYSFGGVTWFCLTGTKPVYADAQKHAIALRENAVQSVALIQVCIDCLAADAGSRPRIREVHASLTSLGQTLADRADGQSRGTVSEEHVEVKTRLQL
eukprot:TRINITY_DN57826_c0_g1_i1.p1 TRINITY_DN57826_c0_g1~~TRINITY_DN57826_c0_g1_i1.p1  ORF type:complete len:652 (+),score=34.41 TRINITY_DN57826_c0_g1_i1:79-2034(+)